MIHTVTKHALTDTYGDWVLVSSGTSSDDNRVAGARNGTASPRSVPQPTADAQNGFQMHSTAMMPKVCCKNPKNLFCFVCGLYILSHHKRSIMTRPLLEAYESYFKVRTSKENYLQGPPSVCNVCNNALLRWKNGMCPKPELPFAIPMLWSQPSDHLTDCYFCLTRTAPPGEKRNSYTSVPIEYPVLRSAIRPKLFAARPTAAPQHTGSGAAQRRISVPPSGSNEQERDAVSSVSIRTYPGQSVKPKEHPRVANGLSQPLVRRSLPPQKIVSNSTVGTYSTTVVGTLKRKIEPDTGGGKPITYGMTKVRLRNSEPTIVLEKCKKLLPSNSAAIIRRPMTPSSADAPRILNVFSLNKDAAICETKPPTPPSDTTSVPLEAIVKIEIEDDDDDDVVDGAAAYNEDVPETQDPVDKSSMEVDPVTGELCIVEGGVRLKIEAEELEPPTVPKQTVVKVEAQKGSPSPSSSLVFREQKVQLVTRAKQGFINVKDLATASSTATLGGSNAIKIKLSSPLDGASSFSAKVVPAVKEETVPPERKPQPSRYCFINMKDMPSISANSVERTVKITTTPTIATGQQPQQSQSTDSTIASATVKPPTVAGVTEQGSIKVLQPMPDQDDGPHRITQSELILLLRELELPKEKSAVLIDRLKRWNLLAIEMVGTNRSRPVETPLVTATSTSSSSSPAAATTLAEKTVTTLTSMKDIQIRNTRSGLRQSTGPPIITSSTSTNINRTSTTTTNSRPLPPPQPVVPADQNGGPAKPTPSTSAKVVTAVVKSDKALPPRRQAATTTTTTTIAPAAAAAGTGLEEKVVQRSSSTIATRSATGAIVKQSVTSPRVK